jgi:glycosyltransferase involved in cell wall biosynthesis
LHSTLSASRGVKRILCVSEAAAQLFAHCPRKVKVIHNALDVVDFDPERVRRALRAEIGLSADAVVFGSHGRVLRRKGYLEMVRAARLALDRMDAWDRERVAFVVVGDTPGDFRPDHVEECRALAAKLGLAGRFRMLGFRSDVRPLVADFDVAVVPSVYADPLPRSVIESMALGKPVIAFDVGGVAEMIEHGRTGELVRFEPEGEGREGASERAVDRLADTFVRYAHDAGLRERQGRAARDHVLRHFDARAHASQIEHEIVHASGLA